MVDNTHVDPLMISVPYEPNTENSIYFFGQLQIDLQRGVVYFHDAKAGITRLRICNLNAESLQRQSQSETFSIDVTPPMGTAMYCG